MVTEINKNHITELLQMGGIATSTFDHQYLKKKFSRKLGKKMSGVYHKLSPPNKSLFTSYVL